MVGHLSEGAIAVRKRPGAGLATRGAVGLQRGRMGKGEGAVPDGARMPGQKGEPPGVF
jgi:hypothetical protein